MGQNASRQVLKAIPLLDEIIPHMVADLVNQFAVRVGDLADMRGVDDDFASVSNRRFGFVHRLGSRPQVIVHLGWGGEHLVKRTGHVGDVELRREIGGLAPGFGVVADVEAVQVLALHHHRQAEQWAWHKSCRLGDNTPVRRVITQAAGFVPRPLLCLAMVMQGQDLHGLYIGDHTEAWSQAADLSAQLDITYVARPFHKVLSAPAEMYDDLWTGAKAMYKTEPAIADGGEVIIYAPHISEVSYTHSKLIDEVGYHVRDYFVKQWDRFQHLPGSILAHSTHVKGTGTYDAATGIETPRISVTLATGIPEERCRRINLGYADYRTIDPNEWKGREQEGILYVPHAGERLYRAPGI